jgi:epoxyqueuosine reductase
LLIGLQAQSTRIAPPLLEGFDATNPYWLEQTAFSARFRRSPVKRAKRHGMLRNVCVALGNWADPCAVEPLARALGDPVALVRGHAAWALGQILRKRNATSAHERLTVALACESDAWVIEEINTALVGHV